MPRPTTKDELLTIGQENFKRLLSFINGLSSEKQSADFPEGTLNRNIRDVLTHIHEWHLMLLKWYEAGMSGEKPNMPAEGYTWKTMPELNRKIWKDYQDTNLEQAKELISESAEKVRELITKHSSDELFEKKRYKWTGSTSMGAYFVSATSSHYDWGFKLIKKATK